ncbi:Bug family tripartite tricarboxylate transporter substrate binding protein [Pollutimonas harenae]|uniref:Tripartite tricarboxylate transporter substrate binding protein n=1 Tax=Pollutimonas harenae TaxID=657015 RepID=A0A853H0D0_9BURK|nr:tripartite tricarboxylate transporter substrate binding protein [Pollutimonas harenae]NYT85159.1 tripartite tricarboxylate transporter substrate binding protein [Pollutimonas harenae]TEA72461.1 tripartite tricarboxylate transporter substrate binding protein [Pollutimonas harenae]
MNSLLKALLVCSLVLPGVSLAQDTAKYTDKPLRFIVPYPPGGLGDTFSRLLADGLQKKRNQPVIVENKPGASQIIGMENMLRAPADGYTVFLGSMTSLATNLGSFKKLSYDPVTDVAPITTLFSTPLFLAVSSDVPVKNVKELVDFAKSKSGELSYASLGMGSSLHLAGELFAQEGGIDLLHVPYKGSVPALTDVMSGVVTMIFDGGSTVIPQAQAGKLRILAVTGDQRSDSLKDVPSMDEVGFSSVDIRVWWGLIARAGTPANAIDQLSKDVNSIISSPDFVASLSSTGIAIKGSTPEEFSALIKKEAGRWPGFMKQVGVVPQ